MHVKPVLSTCLHTVLLLTTLVAFLSMIHVSYAIVIHVPGDYTTIQAAIDARSGESQSIYYERIRVNKPLILVGESPETIIIDGSGAGTVVRVQADSVEIKGFTVRNGGSAYSGIRADSYSYVTIANNTIKTNKNGVLLFESHYSTVSQNRLVNNSAVSIRVSDSLGNNIRNNNMSQSAYGVRLSSTNTTFVVGNTVTDNSYGIYFEGSSNNTIDMNNLQGNSVDSVYSNDCTDILVSNNDISDSAYGIQLYNSTAVSVLDNDVAGCSYGIYLAYSGPSNTIANNSIALNDWGVTLYGSSGNTFTGNEMSDNTYGVDPVTNSNNNQLYHNNFEDNIEQVVWNPNCVNAWHDGYPSGGNYWSDYTGTDANGDGIGDTAYVIDPMNKDQYPLMTPWALVHDIAVTSVTLSDSLSYVGEIVTISVVAENQGTESESFNVTVTYENSTLAIFGTVDTQDVANLASEDTVILTFFWDTAGVQACVNYTITAEACTLTGETDTADNTCVGGKVKVNIPGDLNGDGSVDIFDLSIVSMAYGAFEGEPGYNIDADLNEDGFVDMKDMVIVAKNLGKTC